MEEKKVENKITDRQSLVLIVSCLVLVAVFILYSLNKSVVEESISSDSVNYANSHIAKQTQVLDRIPDKVKKSDVVITGKVIKTQSSMETNSYGDKLIVTRTTVGVLEWLKGTSNKTIEIDIVGGTYNDLTLVVSTQPEPLKSGQSAVMFLTQKTDGNFKVADTDMIEGAEKGIMKLTADGMVNEDGVDVDMIQVRSAIKKSI